MQQICLINLFSNYSRAMNFFTFRERYFTCVIKTKVKFYNFTNFTIKVTNVSELSVIFDIKMGSLLSDKHNRLQTLRPLDKTVIGDDGGDDEFLIGKFVWLFFLDINSEKQRVYGFELSYNLLIGDLDIKTSKLCQFKLISVLIKTLSVITLHSIAVIQLHEHIDLHLSFIMPVGVLSFGIIIQFFKKIITKLCDFLCYSLHYNRSTEQIRTLCVRL